MTFIDTDETPAEAGFIGRREVGISLWVSAHSPMVQAAAGEELRTNGNARTRAAAARVLGMAKSGDTVEAFQRRDAMRMTPGEFRDFRDFVRWAMRKGTCGAGKGRPRSPGRSGDA